MKNHPRSILGEILYMGELVFRNQETYGSQFWVDQPKKKVKRCEAVWDKTFQWSRSHSTPLGHPYLAHPQHRGFQCPAHPKLPVDAGWVSQPDDFNDDYVTTWTPSSNQKHIIRGGFSSFNHLACRVSSPCGNNHGDLIISGQPVRLMKPLR